MSIFDLILLAVGVSMDAFAVSICRGLSLKKVKAWHSIEAGLYFGGFQALMPTIGYFLGNQFYNLIHSFDHWIAFIMLFVLGARMIKNAFSDEEEACQESMFTLAIATSIDALAVGVSLAFLQINIFISALLIGVTTFAFSAVGVRIGAIWGDKCKSKSEIIGGAILIFIGIKILAESLL